MDIEGNKGKGGGRGRKAFRRLKERSRVLVKYLLFIPPQLSLPQKFLYVIFKFTPLLLLLTLLLPILTPKAPKNLPTPVPFTTFLSHISKSRIKTGVGISPRTGQIIYGTGTSRHIVTVPRGAHDVMIGRLLSAGVNFGVLEPTSGERLAKRLTLLIPLAYAGLVYRLYKRITGEGREGMGEVIGGGNVPNVTFDDVVGMDRERREVMEILDSIEKPEKYTSLGARTPKGVLMSGPPGTGKTLLAKALAGSGNVPMITASGSDFMEVFVGRGASRVRDLFKRARRAGRCVVFIDEIDAVGKRRGMGGLGGRGNDEQEQTLNALLACMDGVKGTDGVVVLAATNRPEILDEALTRPGRFDRIVRVNLPERSGRIGIFQLHGSKLTNWSSSSIDLSTLADLTNGFSGAEIEGVCNEAAIRAVRRGGEGVRMEDFEGAIKDFRSSRSKLGIFGM